MRKNIDSVPVQISIGRISAGLADGIVAAGDGLSLKGKAVLMQSSAGLERLLSELEVNPATADLIVRAARLIEARNASAFPPDIPLSRVAVEQTVADVDLDHEAVADVARGVARAREAVIARWKAAPDFQGNRSGDGK